MPHKIRKYELYVTDEPATYNQFDGGINTNPSNEHLEKNEMRDCLNMHYQQGSLVKRNGAKLLATINSDIELFKIQGISLFTYKLTYIVIAANGELYYGIYTPNSTINITKLPIGIRGKITNQLFDPQDMSAGLPTRYEFLRNEEHNGYVYNQNNIRPLLFEDIKLNNRVIGKDQIIVVEKKLYKAKETVTVKINIPNTDYPTYDQWKFYNYLEDEYEYDATLNEATNKIKYDNFLNKFYLWKKIDGNLLTEEQKLNKLIWADTQERYSKGQIVQFGATSENQLPAYVKLEYDNLNFERNAKIQELNSYVQQLNSLKTQLEEYIEMRKESVPAEYTYDFANDAVYNSYLKQIEDIENIIGNRSFITEEKIIIERKGLQGQIQTIEDKLENYIFQNYFICLNSHLVKELPNLEKDFIEIESIENLIFQNSAEIEGATYNNKLYLATGTRLVEVFLNLNGELKAQVVSPYLPNITENLLIGPNYYSPYPEYARSTQYNQAITKIDLILTTAIQEKEFSITGFSSSLIPGLNNQVTYMPNYTESVVRKFVLQPVMTFANVEKPEDYYYKWEKKVDNEWKVVVAFKDNAVSSASYFNLKVLDADLYQYRVTFAKAFKSDVDLETNTATPVLENIKRVNNTNDTDWVVDKAAADYYGQGSTIVFAEPGIEETFNMIHSCKKIIGDGNKFLLYDDAFNSGMWFKTVIDNPGYVTQRGMLSFKTNKNEAVVKVVQFAGAILVFANSPEIGGSIHVIEGKGDDFEGDTYYSPYRRRTANESISCNNPKSVQTAEGLLFFKYFDNVYYIRANQISDEIIDIYSANDRIKKESPEVKIPWNDNTCVSEITQDYYALIWKEKYIIEDDQLVLVHPAMKVKLYYKTNMEIGGKYFYPWLRDESEYFNVDHIIYIEGNPIYLYNNVLVNFNSDIYTDFDKIYECKVHFRAVDLSYPKFYKLLSSVMVYYHRNQNSNIDFEITVKNEAGHELLSSNQPSVQDIKNLKIGNLFNKDRVRLDSTIVDSKLFNTDYRFPLLLADTMIRTKNNQDFTIASITYTYNTVDIPDTNPYDLYVNIIRKKEN